MTRTYLNITASLFVFFSIFFMLPIHTMAQARKVMNRPYIDQRQFHYGFLAGLQLMDLELIQNGYMDEEGNQWSAEAPNYEPGFCVGILGEMKLSEHFALRVIPTMHFGTKGFRFRNEKETLNEDGQPTHERQSQNMKSTYFTVPVDLKFSAQRFNNYRPYMMVGLAPSLDLTIKHGQNLMLKRFDCFLEAGIGCDFYARWFKFIPEIKFCYGLANIINKDRSDLTDKSKLIFTESVDKGRSKMIVITFYFE